MLLDDPWSPKMKMSATKMPRALRRLTSIVSRADELMGISDEKFRFHVWEDKCKQIHVMLKA